MSKAKNKMIYLQQDLCADPSGVLLPVAEALPEGDRRLVSGSPESGDLTALALLARSGRELEGRLRFGELAGLFNAGPLLETQT
jgi:hypothetical protein